MLYFVCVVYLVCVYYSTTASFIVLYCYTVFYGIISYIHDWYIDEIDTGLK